MLRSCLLIILICFELAFGNVQPVLFAEEVQLWKGKRYLERDSEADVKVGAGSYHYPSIIQAKDGTLHASYSFHQKKSETKRDATGKPASESIKPAHFNETWVMQGDGR